MTPQRIASRVTNLRRRKARDFDAFVDDGHLFLRNAGLGENSRDPFGNRQDASGGAITRTREIVFFEREADAPRNDKRYAAMRASEPSGSDGVRFIGVDESKFADRRREVRDRDCWSEEAPQFLARRRVRVVRRETE